MGDYVNCVSMRWLGLHFEMIGLMLIWVNQDECTTVVKIDRCGCDVV